MGDENSNQQTTQTNTAPANASGAAVTPPAVSTPPAAPAAVTPPAVVTPPATGAAVTPAAGAPATQTPPAAAVVTPPAVVVHDYAAVKLPTETLLEQAHVDAAIAVGKKHNLAPAAVQALVDARHDELKTVRAQWQTQLTEHETLGGKNLPATIAASAKVLTRYAKPEFIAFLDKSGLGNLPAVAEFLNNIAKSMGDDRLPSTSGAGGIDANQPRTLEDVLYPVKK